MARSRRGQPKCTGGFLVVPLEEKSYCFHMPGKDKVLFYSSFLILLDHHRMKPTVVENIQVQLFKPSSFLFVLLQCYYTVTPGRTGG